MYDCITMSVNLFFLINAGKVVGVAQLCNKIGGGIFTKFDEMIATGFAVLCSISVMHVSSIHVFVSMSRF